MLAYCNKKSSFENNEKYILFGKVKQIYYSDEIFEKSSSVAVTEIISPMIKLYSYIA